MRSTGNKVHTQFIHSGQYLTHSYAGDVSVVSYLRLVIDSSSDVCMSREIESANSETLVQRIASGDSLTTVLASTTPFRPCRSEGMVGRVFREGGTSEKGKSSALSQIKAKRMGEIVSMKSFRRLQSLILLQFELISFHLIIFFSPLLSLTFLLVRPRRARMQRNVQSEPNRHSDVGNE